MSDTESEDLQELLACPGLYQEVQQPRQLINNKNALKQLLGQLEMNLPWVERLDLIAAPSKLEVESKPTKKKGQGPPSNDPIDVNNDFDREAYFYRQAQSGVLEGLKKLHGFNIPTKRPTDFFAEMIKSDHHMNKISENLVAQKKRMELAERARQLREQRKFGKKTQIEVLNSRKQEKKRLGEAIKSARKKSAKGQKIDLDSILTEIQMESAAKQKNRKQKLDSRSSKVEDKSKSGLDMHLSRVSKKRDYKNKRYGFGGPKKRNKWNDKSSNEKTTGFKVLTHQTSSARINKLKKQMVKSKKQNQMKQKRKLSTMSL